MNTDCTAAMNRLREIAPRLVELDAEMQNVIARVEHFLSRECQIELPASVLVARDDDEGAEVLFSYDRHDDAFKLLVVTRKSMRDQRNQPVLEPDGTPTIGQVEVRCWKDCERPLRMMSFSRLPDLLAQLTTHVEQSIELGERASTTGKQLLAAMGGT